MHQTHTTCTACGVELHDHEQTRGVCDSCAPASEVQK